MNVLQNYRTSFQFIEIVDALINIQIEATPVLIWQNILGLRKVVHAKIESINLNSKTVTLLPFSIDDRNLFESFETDNTVYLRGSIKSIVFKQDRPATKNDKGMLTILIPEEVKMYENRSISRIHPEKSEEKKTFSQIIPTRSCYTGTKAYYCELVDVSISGLGLWLEKKYARLFNQNDNIKIASIGSYYFQKPLSGNIVFIGDVDQKTGRFRIGIKFSENIGLDVLRCVF